MPSPDYPQLPPGFVLGATTAAYQVEGAVTADGRGPSIWDTFTQREGAVDDGSSGQVAADHYHRVEEDLDLLKRLGVDGYRFSISWSRIQPTGSGAVNPAGLDFYDRLVDGLLARGIEPMVTLYHGDLPQGLEDDGGWLNRTTIDRFAEYAAVVGERLADRVAHWIPVSEPSVVSLGGYGIGTHAPGRRLYLDALMAAHHLLLGHGRAVVALREAGASSVGCANNHAPMWPNSEDPADVGATKLVDAVWNGFYLESMLLGRYPRDLQPLLEGLIQPGDMATIRQPLDFYGVNYFSPMRVEAAPDEAELPFVLREVLGYPITDAGRAVVPDALREWLIMLRARFRAALPPVVITESGFADRLGPDESGQVDDQARIDYLSSHLRAVLEASQRGVDIRGYYTWSLLDSFEWSAGLQLRYGLVHVDHETQERTPKSSFEWYAGLIAAQTTSLG